MKLKTHQAHASRFKISSTGKFMHKHAAASHLRVNKSPRQTGTVEVNNSDVKRFNKVLPYS